MDEAQRHWRVGELAQAAGLTVRTLHHFDEIGLLKPSVRTPLGHRLYSDEDIRRLYRVLALREMGLPLAEIGRSLEDPQASVRAAMARQLAQLDERLAQLTGVRERLVTALRTPGEPTVDELITAMEAMMSYFTPEQLSRLKARHGEVGGDAFGQWRRTWSELDAEAQHLASSGADPADEPAQELGRRWSELMADMTGGDRQILSAMYAKLDGQGAEAATLGVVSSTAWSYLKRVFAVGYGGSLS